MDKWIKDKYTDNFICPKCGYMVTHNGYGGCDYKFCPECGRPVEPVNAEDKGSEKNERNGISINEIKSTCCT